MKRKITLWIILLLPYAGLFIVWQYHRKEVAKIANASFIVVSKEEMTLTLYDYKGKILEKYPCACGANFGDKQKVGDLKTPEGVFTITDIQKASHWVHDFKDGKGEIKGAYGPYFLRLNTPNHKGIGIHGTHDNESIGTRATDGCVRLKNEDLEKLVKSVQIGNIVVITPSKDDVISIE